MKLRYLSCEGCSNIRKAIIWDMVVYYCGANVDDPSKCILKKRERVLNPDIAEFFNATCERYRNAR